MLREKGHILLPLFLGITSLVDLILTLIAKHYTTAFYEANPLMRYVIDQYSSLEFAIIKIIGTLLICFCTWHVLKIGSRIEKFILTTFGIIVQSVLMGWWVVWWYMIWNYHAESFI